MMRGYGVISLHNIIEVGWREVCIKGEAVGVMGLHNAIDIG